jgi:Protein of unknown function (DUF3168)
VSVFEADLRTFILTLDAVTALAGDRVYGVVRSQASALPQVLLTRTGTVRQVTICRTSKLVSCDMQIDSYGLTGQDAWGLAAALRAALVDFEGEMGATEVQRVFLTNEFPLADPEPGVIRITQLFNIWYVED